MYLRQPEIASIVTASIRKGVELGHYDLVAYVVMANHVHLRIWPKIAPDQLMKSLKGATAREANRLLGRRGEPFWQKESYDHWVRNAAELEKIRSYIENNPVKAGQVQNPCEFRWSSAGVETSLDAARTSACATGPRHDVASGYNLLAMPDALRIRREQMHVFAQRVVPKLTEEIAQDLIARRILARSVFLRYCCAAGSSGAFTMPFASGFWKTLRSGCLSIFRPGPLSTSRSEEDSGRHGIDQLGEDPPTSRRPAEWPCE